MARRRTTGKGMGPRGKLGSKQSQANRARFKSRVAQGKSGLTGGKKGSGIAGTKGSTIANYRAAQRQQVTNAAIARNAARVTGIPSGKNLKAGSFGISEAGKIQAEKNKAEAAAKKAAAQQEATRQSTFNPSRVFNPTTANNNMVSFSAAYNNPLSTNRYFNLGKNVRVPNEDTASFRKLFKDDMSQVTRTDKGFKAGDKSLKSFRPFKAFTDKDMRATGPTPLVRQFATRFLPGALKNISLGSQIFNLGQDNSGLTQSLNQVGNINAGGLSIGFNSPESTDIGARVGKFFTGLPARVADAFTGGDTQVASTDAGGLNIGGGVDSGEAEGSNTARTLTARFNKPGFDTLAGGLDFATNDRFDFDNLGKGLFGYNAVTPSNVINDAMSIAQNKNLTVKDMGTFLNTVKDISTSDDKIGTVKNILSNEDTTSRLLGPVYNQLRDSQIVDSLATKKLGLPDNYGQQLDQTKGALETAYNKLGTDDKANRRIISDLFIGKDSNLNLLKRGAEQFTNESGTIANYQDKTNLAKFQDSFKENSPLFKGLNKDERGMIGSLGNWRLSNLGTDIVGSNLEGTNNVADLASNIIDTAGTNKATQSFLKTVGVKGAPTPKSIIGGVLPRLGGNRNPSGTMNRLQSSAGSNATTLAAATPTSVEEVLPMPTTATQTGTNSGNLAGIMQNAYTNQMSLYGMNPNFLASFQQPRFNTQPKRFRQVFNRGYF